jgi:hypothetical protein
MGEGSWGRAKPEMIRYTLKCPAGHLFDSWFRDSAAFDTLAGQGRVACAVCGATAVEKALMAPSVRGDEPSRVGADADAARPAKLAEPNSPIERALAELRRHLSENSDYVGDTFADEARRIHLGEADARSIWGEASAEEAKSLKEDGIPVAPLPWLARRND